MSPGFSLVAVLPVYNHEDAVGRVVAGLRAAGLPVILVDDGSAPRCRAVLQQLAGAADVSLVVNPHNLGKGGAVSAGLRAALQAGHTHALQIDADGQHTLADIPRFIAAARVEPNAVICGQPVFDQSVPRLRFYSRYLTHVLVWVHTLSFDIRDSMCGFRIYPLTAVVSVLDSARLGLRMDFDPELLVRLHWRGQPIRWLATRVAYPLDGISHFRMLEDNLRISWMHARMFAGMLVRSPSILWRRLRFAPVTPAARSR
ncbi:MAG: glycosyltransferase family 2 protein [Proteobacteria bacterium]|nr:glycosyltransferase family 2 protein [Pseudomonadota bacterium]